MPKSFNQKLKILYLMDVLLERTDEEHPITAKDMAQYLRASGALSGCDTFSYTDSSCKSDLVLCKSQGGCTIFQCDGTDFSGIVF